jgi:hypothetical protein
VPILIFLHVFIIYDLFIYYLPPTGKASADGKKTSGGSPGFFFF